MIRLELVIRYKIVGAATLNSLVPMSVLILDITTVGALVVRIVRAGTNGRRSELR